jgi:hypothetical protein
MTSTPIIAAWLVYAVALPSDASQSVTAIPFSSFDACERRMEKILPGLLEAAEIIGPQRRPITIKPYCTTVAPPFWVQPRTLP